MGYLDAISTRRRTTRRGLTRLCVVCLLLIGTTAPQAAKNGVEKTPAPSPETPEPPPDAPPPSVDPPEDHPPAAPWVGQLRVDDDRRGYLGADGSYVLPILAHFGEAFSAYVRRPRAVEQQLTVIKQAGYDGIRFWDNLGYYPEWQGREVTPFGFYNKASVWVPATDRYYERLGEFLVTLRRLGLAAHHSRGDLNTVSLNQVVAHSERVRDLYREVGLDVVALYEGNNEDWQNGSLLPDGLQLVVAPLAEEGVLTALSHHSEEPSDIQTYATETLFYVHGYRLGTSTDRIRHIFSVSYERLPEVPRLGWQGEPIGPGSSVNSTTEAEELGLLAGMSLMARQAWTYMSGHGAFWDGPLEEQPGFRVVPQVRAFLREYAPDVMAFSPLVHGGRESAVLIPADAFFDPERGVTEGIARLDQAISEDGRVVGLVYGGEGRKRILNRSARIYDLRVATPHAEGLDVQTRVLHPGETLDLEYEVGRILIGVPR